MGQKGMPVMKMQAMKQSIRQRIIADREQLPANFRAQFSTEIMRRLLQMAQYRSAGTVLGYMNFGAEFMADTLMQQVLKDKKRLLLPKVNLEKKELDAYYICDLQHDLAPGLWDIREPVPGRCSKAETLNEVDFILLPGVAFGRNGERLGYGGGFYDKLIASLSHKPTLVAASFSMQIVDKIPQEPTDRKVEWLVTENEVIKCSGVKDN